MFKQFKTSKVFKLLSLVLVVVLLTGCTSNLDSEGQLIATRAINDGTIWSMDAGWFDFFLVIPISKGILFLGDVLGNVALGVIGTTILINILTLPVMIKSTVSSQKMQLLQPEMERIQRKYKGRKDQTSQMRMNSEIQALYKKNNISMLSTLSTLLTLPIMLAMWQSVQRLEILYTTDFFGFNLGAVPMEYITSFNILYIVLISLVAITQFSAMDITSRMAKRSPRYKPNSQASQMKTMNNVMTVMIVFFAVSMPTAMSFYWITTNIISICRTIYIQIFHIEKTKKEVEDSNTTYLNK